MVGAAWQDAVIRGAAAFVVKRAKAEALAYIRDLLAADLCEPGDKYLPTTCTILKFPASLTTKRYGPVCVLRPSWISLPSRHGC